MKPSLKAGLKHSFAYTVPETKTVPHLYRESPELQAMPEVFATGFMVGLMEWTCVQLLAPHLESGEGSLGTHIDVSHKSATPPGMKMFPCRSWKKRTQPVMACCVSSTCSDTGSIRI